ncbi:MAG: hypothetical protein QM796_18075 [Chthoniobacteraceae bacterium]
MVFVFNPIGALICFLPAVLASFTWVYLPRSSDIWTLVGAWAIIAFVWDVLYRLFNRDEHWLSPGRGGHLCFIPVFILAALAFGWYVHQALTLGFWFPHATPDPNAIPL